MMANPAKAPFDSENWIYEMKLDGYRAIARFDSTGKPQLRSRNGIPMENKFPAVASAIAKLKLRSTILDGEIVAVDDTGIPRFQLLQRYQKQPTAPTVYYVFDLLFHHCIDLTQKPLLERRATLELILKPTPGIQLATYTEQHGIALFQLVKDRGIEGIVAKRKDSLYRPGKRTSDWLKIKATLQQEFVVAGFTAPKGARKHLGAIVIGAYSDNILRHYGYAGSGFTEKELKEAVEKMRPLFTTKSPFPRPPKTKEKIQWLKPELVCKIQYAELTADNQLRHTTFLGWRDDKPAGEVIFEQL